MLRQALETGRLDHLNVRQGLVWPNSVQQGRNFEDYRDGARSRAHHSEATGEGHRDPVWRAVARPYPWRASGGRFGNREE